MGAPAWRERRRFRLPLGGRSAPRGGTRDQLTGFLQRGAFEAVATYALRRSRSLEEPTGVVCVVVDHEASAPGEVDQLGLKHVAEVLSHNVRGEDVLGRIGANELCALLPGVGESDTKEVARRLDGALAPGGPSIAFLRPGIGWAVMDSWGASLEEDLRDLVRRARDGAS
ncbi:MAG: diguanylate cyclase [Actinomycetota bacterium]|nr:diguanylate cyclase [Actinomycetota bacterium]